MKKVLIIGITIVAVIALGNVLLVSAQGGTQPNQPNATCPMGYTCPFSGTPPYGTPGGMMGRGMLGGGMMGGNHAQMHDAMMDADGMHEQVWAAVAQKLGLTYEELNTALQNGQTVAQLAQAKGVSLDELKTVALDAMRTSFAELVEQGVMTQDQADWMLDRMDDMPMFNFDQGFGPGMMGGRGGMHGNWQNGTPPNGTQPNNSYGRGMMRGWQQPTGPQG
jgi:hypothetical protein